jgi:regulator of protease activity HflC (stomatin/prohibitin superfamily)
LGKFLGGIGVAVAVFVVIFGVRSIVGVTIDSSHVGVVSNWGHVDPNQTPLGPGYNTINPFGGYNIIAVDTRPQSFKFSEVQGAGSDGQAIFFDVAINYEVQPDKAAMLVIKGGPDDPADHLLQTIITPNVNSALKSLSPNYSILPGTTNYVLGHRPDIQLVLDRELSPLLDQWGITVLPNGITLPNVHADPTFEKAIEATALSQQGLQKAQADAAAQVAKAQGDATANALKQQQIAQQQVDIANIYAQAALTAAQKWDGKLPATYMGGSGLPFVNVNPTTGPTK